MTLAVNIAQSGSNNVTFRNKLINGAQVIDQRNAGAAVTGINSAGTYITDRWKSMAVNSWAGSSFAFTGQQNRGSVTPPAGFSNYLGVSTTTAAATPPATATFDLTQVIEGYNIADLAWGSASAKSVTLSFWVYSNLTGTFGGSICNSAYNRFYIFSYSVTTANTWTQISVTIAGDTSGTWLTTNGIGMNVSFSLGAGSSMVTTAGSWGATTYGGVTGQQQICASTSNYFYITGVQLEAGTTASPFEYRQYGTELALCQRYFQTTYPSGYALGSTGSGISYSMETIAQATTSYLPVGWNMPVVMRANPTATLYNPFSGSSSASDNIRGTSGSNFPSAQANVSQNGVLFYVNNSSVGATNAIVAHFAVTSEL
jgi:hypothetical protein